MTHNKPPVRAATPQKPASQNHPQPTKATPHVTGNLCWHLVDKYLRDRKYKSFRDFSKVSAPTFNTPWGVMPDDPFAAGNVVGFKNFWCRLAEAGEGYKAKTEFLLGGPQTGPHVAVILKNDGNRLTIYHQNSPPGAGPRQDLISIVAGECRYEDLVTWQPVKNS